MTTTPETGRVPSPIEDCYMLCYDDDTYYEPCPSAKPDAPGMTRVKRFPIGPDGLIEPERQLATTRALLDEARAKLGTVSRAAKYRQHRIGELSADLDEAVGIVSRYEWSLSIFGEPGCPECREEKCDGHAPDCPLAAFLKKVEDADAHRTTK